MAVPTPSVEGRPDVIAFIGGGHMASALIGGLLGAGRTPHQLIVVEPFEAARDRLAERHGVRALARADATLQRAGTVVWAVKPQQFAEAARGCAAHVAGALQLSVMAGIRTGALARAIKLAPMQARIVRAMPNTPALIGRGIAGLYATGAVQPAERSRIELLLAPTGATLWVSHEAALDTVTALSGSGPAYVFYLIEAMMEAAAEMGLSPEHGRRLAIATFDGAAELARRSSESPEALRAQVTSKGGTTHAAISSLEADGFKALFVKALHAAAERARELGDEFG
jgi:pyrroline-5-carboxylate reductase